MTFKDEGVDGRRESTIKREAYFIEYAKAVREVAEMPVMVTGNFRTTAGMNEALDNGELDIVGIGRPFIADPLTAKHLLEGELERALTPEENINVIYTLPWFNMQLERLGDGLEPDLELEGPEAAVQFQQIEEQNYAAVLKYRSQ